MAVISTSLNEKTFFVPYAMPFKYRDKRNAYFKDYMRKRRPEEEKRKPQSANGNSQKGSINDQHSVSSDRKIIEIVAI